ncbi:MAG TPA: hypothetical protein VM658_21980 [bacterium]|nr:hypothetical protein [bacterium]
MEFKFSCKWFEIALGGDPGFVDIQLAKYEPYIFHVLKKIEHDMLNSEREDKKPLRPENGPAPAAKEPRPPEAQRAPAERGPDQRGQAERGPDQRAQGERRGRGGRWERRRRDNQPRKEASARDVGGGDFPLSREYEEREEHPAPLPPEVAEEQARETMHEIAAGAGAPELPFEETAAGKSLAIGPDQGPPGPETFAGPEFLLRRRTPRIMAEELVRVIEAKKPRTHHDRIMVFGYYMEQEGGGSDFTIAEINRCYRAVGQDPGINIEQVINHATRSGFILSQDKGGTARYKLSSKGRSYVEDGLRLS